MVPERMMYAGPPPPREAQGEDAMRMIVVAGVLTVALFVAVLGAIGAQPVFTQSGSTDEAGPNLTQRVPVNAPAERYRG